MRKIGFKKKAGKIALIISFIPYVFILLYSLYSAFAGFTFLFSTSYGFEAFTDSIVILSAMMWICPILPACVLYQLTYLITYIMKKRQVDRKKIVITDIIITTLFITIVGLIYVNM